VPAPGYCRFCDSKNWATADLQESADKRVNEWGYRRFNKWLVEEVGMESCSNKTFYAHREHIMHPQDRIVSAVEKRQREGGLQPAQTTHEEFLQSLVSIGAMKIAEDPEAVTVDQALKAAKIQSDNQKKGQGNNVLIQLFTGGGGEEPTIIEGEVKEA
jgi:hypothetical protein